MRASKKKTDGVSSENCGPGMVAGRSRKRVSGSSFSQSVQQRSASLIVTRSQFSATVAVASIGAALLWLALPPVGASVLAWIAPCFWCSLIVRRAALTSREFVALGAVGFAFWLAALHWLRLPHWATSFGWVALSFYLGWYLPVFVGLSRVAVHRCRVPLPLAAATVWAGLEVVRAHLLTGFTMASLAHTQYRWLSLIQVADLVGTYGVGWVMVFVSATLYQAICDIHDAFCASSGKRPDISGTSRLRAVFSFEPRHPLVRLISRLGPVVLLMTTVLLYGHDRLAKTAVLSSAETVKVALIQGSQDIRLEDDEEKRERIHRHYLELAYLAARQYQNLDLMVWPETVYGGFLVDYDDSPGVPPEWRQQGRSDAEFRKKLPQIRANSESAMERLASQLGCRLILGVETVAYTRSGIQMYNSAAFIGRCKDDQVLPHDSKSSSVTEIKSPDGHSPKGNPPQVDKENDFCYLGRYDKMHLVMFGEYVPFAERVPFLRYLTPLSTNTTPGREPKAFCIEGVRFSPNICFETVIPHLIRRQVLELRKHGSEPHVLVNLTNDGWFWGSSELDMHLVCAVFRAVEIRKPFLIAANTGFSAVIDPRGQIHQQGPRRDVAILVAEVGPTHLKSWYLGYGIIPDTVFFAAVAFLLTLEIASRVLHHLRQPPTRGSAA